MIFIGNRIENIFEPTEIRPIPGGYEFRSPRLSDVKWYFELAMHKAQLAIIKQMQKSYRFVEYYVDITKNIW